MDIELDDGRTHSPARMWLICSAAVLIPWIWGVVVMPWWVAALSLLFSLISVYLVVSMVKSQTAIAREEVAGAQRALLDRREASVQNDGPLREMLIQWMDASSMANNGLEQALAILNEVTQQSEAAAASIGQSFRKVMGKSTEQMDDALKLLKASSDGEGGSTWLSLPDFIKAYEKQLDNVTGRMMDFSKASEEMSQHQDVVREHSLAIDEMLDELRNMASRIRKLALDSTVAVNHETGGEQRFFIEIANRIRETSTSAHELTRRMRDGLEKIRVVMGSTYEDLSRSSDNVRMAAVQARVDVSQLNIATMEKAREVTVTLEKITSLGKEVQRDINQIIVAMQYQDITQQKLEQVKSPLLTTVTASLAEAAARAQAAGIRESKDAASQVPLKVRADLAPGVAKKVDVELF